MFINISTEGRKNEVVRFNGYLYVSGDNLIKAMVTQKAHEWNAHIYDKYIGWESNKNFCNKQDAFDWVEYCHDKLNNIRYELNEMNCGMGHIRFTDNEIRKQLEEIVNGENK